ncbi:DNA recombination protein RmuC [Pengzhenrongella sp.]|jgi:DNA recombination protein RmuC|uniref:DNA recombination protein RmuC n=1 Tax=Pengzhenrongella sp. TaxID=2888820 RepID=UPI002F95BF3E
MNISTALLLVTGALLLGVLAGWSLAGSRVGAAQVRAARAQAQLEVERASATERVGSLQADQARLTEQFRALAADALATNNEQFLALADQRLMASQQTQASELARREEAVKALVEPLTRTLDAVKVEMTTAEKARLTGEAALGEQVRAMRVSSDLLRTETSQLVTALRSSQVRGKWGEIQLRRVVESAGMVEHVDFVEQDQVRTDDGALRPDMVIKLSGGKNIVVDAKVAFLGYLDATQATDDVVRAQRLAAHSRHFRKHIDDLAAKRYWDQFAPAPEFVVMFVPAEAFFHAALEQDATLFEYAFERNVVVATPMTFIALLRTVAYAWRQDALATNAQQVLTLGKELHGRIATLGNHLAKLGRAIDSAAGAYNQTVSSLETRVLVSARRFADLHVVDADLPTPTPVNPQLSAVSAPELVASATEQIVALDDVVRDESARPAR